MAGIRDITIVDSNARESKTSESGTIKILCSPDSCGSSNLTVYRRTIALDGLQGTVASVDSELTLLYQRLLGVQPPVPGRVANPYFLGDKALTEARPFTRVSREIYLVTRLDGFGSCSDRQYRSIPPWAGHAGPPRARR